MSITQSFNQNTDGTLALSDGASTSTIQTNGSQKTQLVDGSGNIIASINNQLQTINTPTIVFDDTYATSSTLDTVNRWNTPISAGGGVVATVPVGGGDVALGSGTIANGYSVLTSQFNFNQVAPGFLEIYNGINLEFPITLNTYRYWGFGTPVATPTASTPVTDGLGFEVATTGKMYAISYSGGTRHIIGDLSTGTGNSTQPQDTAVHKYVIFFRGDLAYWQIDGILVATMLTGAPGPINNTLPIAFLAIAGSTAPSSSGILTVNGTWIGDTTGTGIQISDGTFAWKKAQVLNNQLAARDVINVTTKYRAQSVTTTAAQALGSATILVNRKFISITPTNGTIYWGTDSSVTSSNAAGLIFPNNTLTLAFTDNIPVWVIGTATTNVFIIEGS